MHCHANARLTPRGRATVFLLVEAGMTVSAACLAARVSRRFYYRWLPRWQAEQRLYLIEAASVPHLQERERRALLRSLERQMGHATEDRSAVVPKTMLPTALRMIGVGYRVKPGKASQENRQESTTDTSGKKG